MGHLFVAERLVVDPHITAIDSTLLKAKGHLWHKSPMMEKGVVPRSGIDTDARWGWIQSYHEGWVFGYKLHLTSTTGDLVVPLTADVTTANVLLCCMIRKTVKTMLYFKEIVLNYDCFLCMFSIKTLTKNDLLNHATKHS